MNISSAHIKTIYRCVLKSEFTIYIHSGQIMLCNQSNRKWQTNDQSSTGWYCVGWLDVMSGAIG